MDYDEVLDTCGIKIPLIRPVVNAMIEGFIRADRYEGSERAKVMRLVRPGDRVLELGSGLGLLSTAAAQVGGVQVVTVEANPELIPVIRETHRLNGVDVTVLNGIATAEDGPDIDFYLREEFWGSSMEPGPTPYVEKRPLPRLALPRLMAEYRPTVLLSDIEGGELNLFDNLDLSGLRGMVIETHRKTYGVEGLHHLCGTLAAKGLHPPPGWGSDGVVQLLLRDGEKMRPRSVLEPLRANNKDRKDRPKAAPAPAPVPTPAPAPLPSGPVFAERPWNPAAPRVFVATCMKDEGPFILEWVAWHKAMGVTDIVVFTNDCTDGTDRILDRLEDMGHVRRLPNPASSMQSTKFQPVALDYVPWLRQMHEADFFISMDVDEFLNVRAGMGTLPDLFRATGPFDVLSMSEVNHSSNRRAGFERGWLTELFPLHQSSTPGRYKARRGIKSIVRLSPRLDRIRNHRPDMRDDMGPVIWLDGSGRPTRHFMADRDENGHDARGTYGLIRLEHYPLRSLDSFLAKMARGDVVIRDKKLTRGYWRLRNHHEEASAGFDHQLERAREWHARHLAGDFALMELHEAACAAHEATIARLMQEPEMIERRDWIMQNAWDRQASGAADDATDGPDHAQAAE